MEGFASPCMHRICRSATIQYSQTKNKGRTHRCAHALSGEFRFQELLGSSVLLAPVVFFLKLFDSTRRIHELHLAGEERMRG